jgi:opacity protein-like surface antigen
MKNITKIILLFLLFFSSRCYSVEITPFLGYRGGGEFIDETSDTKYDIASSDIYGLLISFPATQGKTYELYYSHQSSELGTTDTSSPPAAPASTDIPFTIDYLHLGGTTPIYDEKKLKTFLSGGVGFTYLSPDISGAESDLRLSLSIGLGLKYRLTESIALRLETRGLGTLFNNSSVLLCNGGCTLTVNGNLFLQAEVFAGVAFKF